MISGLIQNAVNKKVSQVASDPAPAPYQPSYMAKPEDSIVIGSSQGNGSSQTTNTVQTTSSSVKQPVAQQTTAPKVDAPDASSTPHQPSYTAKPVNSVALNDNPVNANKYTRDAYANPEPVSSEPTEEQKNGFDELYQKNMPSNAQPTIQVPYSSVDAQNRDANVKKIMKSNVFAKKPAVDDSADRETVLKSEATTTSPSTDNTFGGLSTMQIGDKVMNGTATPEQLDWYKQKVMQMDSKKVGDGVPQATQEDIANAKADAVKREKNWRDNIQAKEDEKAKANRLSVLAIGDALRHIGNLYYTTKGATPQKLINQAPEEYTRQETERIQRNKEKLAQQKMQNDLDKANAELAEKKRVNDANIAAKKAGIDKIYTELGIKANKAPYEVEKAISDALAAKAKAEKAGSDAERAKYAAKYEEDLKKADLAYKKAQKAAADARAQASRSTAALNAAKLKTENDKHYSYYPVPRDDHSFWQISKESSKDKNSELMRGLAGIARKNNWSDAGLDKDNNQKISSTEALIDAAFEHYDDQEVQKLMNKYGKKVKNNFKEEDHYNLNGTK